VPSAENGRFCQSHHPGYREAVVALLFAAVAVGLSNLAAAIGIGVTGVNARVRLQVGAVFGVFESGMPVVGLLIGQRFASVLGQAVRWPGAILLIVIGGQALVRSIRDGRRQAAPDAGPGGAAGAALAGGSQHIGRLLASGLVLSLDNLVVGFALGTYGVGIAEGAILIGAISVAMSLLGLELGGLLGRWAGHRSEQMSGLILILVGAAIAGGALT